MIDLSAIVPCPHCGGPTCEGIVTATLTPSGHREIHGVFCPACEWYESHDGEHASQQKAKPMTDTTRETINVIHSENGIKTVCIAELPNANISSERKITAKLSPYLPTAPALDSLILFAYEKTAPFRARVVSLDAPDIAEDLSASYPWVVAVIDESVQTRTLADESDLRRAIARANALASAKAILANLPEEVRSLAKPTGEDPV